MGLGAGDLNIKAECRLLTQTCSIEDCLIYDPCTSASDKWTIPSGVISTYDSNGWKSYGNAYKQVKLTDKLTTDCSVEFTLNGYDTTSNPCIIIYQYTNGETTPNQAILMGGSTSSNNRKVFNTQLDHDLIIGAVYRIEYTSSTIKVYENNTLLGQATNAVGFPTRFEFHTGTNRYAIYKDLKVKLL